MAAVLQFRRKAAPASWANEELAEFYRIVDVMGRAGLAISVDVGASDEGEPWVAFVREDTGDVLAHIARIDGWIVAVSAATNEVVRAQSLKEVVRRIVDTHPLVLLPAHRPGSHIHVHPCAVLAAFIAAAYVLAEGVQSEVHAREFAESMAADHAAATAAALAALPPPKVAAHPNPLRSALTSISDFLRGVGDLVQPVSINTTSANAAIAAVVALVLSGDETGSVATHAGSANEASIIASMLAGAASAAEARDEAAARSSAPQHVVGLDAGLVDPELKPDLTKTPERFTEAQQTASQTEAAVAAPREHAQPDGSVEIVAQAQVKPAESVVRLSADLSAVSHAVAAAAPVEAASDRTAKPAASESISTAPSTVAGTAASSAAKSDYASAASTAIASATTSAAARTTSTDSATDHNGLHVAGQGETTVLRLSDISKYALSALRITDALISALDQVTVPTAKSDLSDATIVATASLTTDSSAVKISDVSITSGPVSTTIVAASTSTVASLDLTSPVVKAPSTNAAYIEVSDASVTTTTSSVAAASSSAASVVTPASQSATMATTAAPTTERPSSAYDIITGILTFAFGDHPTFAANAAARAEITQDLARHGMSTTSQRVLIFSSETVTVPVFELMPGVVLVDGQEIAKENRSAHALDVTSASKVIYLPDGGTLNLIGVIDFSIPI